ALWLLFNSREGSFDESSAPSEGAAGAAAISSEPAACFGQGLAQRRAGALDAAAGLAQRLGRGGVGDAEMGRQAEGHALHHRDALGGEQVLDEVRVVLDRLALGRALAERAGAGRIDIER